jgi:pimeloyl-ACP methyl ester carboxylesterase
MTCPIDVHVLRGGAPWVLLAHGLADGWESWRALAARLPHGWGVAALDLPWRAGNDYRWRQTATPSQWLKTGIDLLGEPVHAVVGHSFGANAALGLMASGDGSVGSAAVLICPFYRPPTAEVTWRMLDRSRQTFVENIREGVRARMGARAERTDAEVLDAMLAEAVDRVGPLGLLTAFDQFVASTDLPLHAVEQPTMILAGGADPVLSAATAVRLAERVPRATLHADEGFDHYCHIRRPAQVAALAGEFLSAAQAAVLQSEGRAAL